ncbi:TetR/AcrR family transcriptional regulator [Pseudonocardia nigra]|uniref:TetR/AcrR family transcriptional regulator n=1 Tax=Pseudonocardia nigra TaxID=1921578 RepID=UPI0027E32AE4|nr:TetR/AcrR family transcriptional regulator [Pseudonocardia nigra]
MQSGSRESDALIVRIPSTAPDRGRRAAPPGRGPDARTLRTRVAVVEAATALFLQHGYQRTSTEDIARAAGVSKRTVYNNFADKEALFTEIVLGITATAERFADEVVATLRDAEDVPAALHTLARRHLEVVTRPQILQLRQLLIAEARRFPALAREYHRGAPGRVIDALAVAFRELAERGALNAPDPQRAAEHFAFLVLGASLDRAMFAADATPPSTEERDRIADDGARVFLAAYRAR